MAAAGVSGQPGVESPAALAPGYELPGYQHDNGMTGRLLFPEMTGQGAALVDYDGDGDLDVYLVQGGSLGAGEEGGAPSGPGDMLLRNDGAAGRVDWVDVTDRANLRATGYGMAVATGDIDRDGAVDLLLANYGANQLWRNRGDGSFEDASSLLQEPVPAWSTAGAIFDFDGDGWEDLYIANYVDYSVDEAPACYAASSMPDYCGPSAFAPQPDRLLRNQGGGRFADVTQSSGVGRVAGPALGLAVLDGDDDGRVELYVANDGRPNYLWLPREEGWVDDALLAGLAVNRRGEPEASMGIAVGDPDRDGDDDLLVTHLDGETHTLYVNQGGGLFDDRTAESGLGGPSLASTGFGVAWVDLDHDGWLDLAIVNGAVRIEPDLAATGDPHPLGQADQLLVNRRGVFEPLPAPENWSALQASRGLAGGDIDNDGDRDLLVTANAGKARVFSNRAATATNWLGISLAGGSGARVRREAPEGRIDATRATSIGSYASAADPRVLFGGATVSVSIETLDGRWVRVQNPPAGHYLRVP